MADRTNDLVGGRGEAIAELILIRPEGEPPRFLFEPNHLGDKYPTADLLVDLLGPDGFPLGHFFAQLKSTTTRISPRGRLTIDVDPEAYTRLANLPAPTYLIGVLTPTEEAYLVAVVRPRAARLRSIPTAFRLADPAVKLGLYEEVEAYWRESRPRVYASRFDRD